MQSVGYWEAWSLWWSGQKLDAMSMWGVPMLWWARVGKLLQFTGGLVVVLDLIGPKRLEVAAQKISTRARKIAKVVRTENVILALTFVGAVLAIVVDTYALFQAFFGRLPLLAIGVTTGAFFVAIGLGMFANKLAIPVIKLLKSNDATHPLRWFAFILICLGFHLDLLAS